MTQWGFENTILATTIFYFISSTQAEALLFTADKHTVT
jgi:hypothetical protein